MKPILIDGELWRTYTFEYGYQGKRWGFDIVARDPDDAVARVKAL